MKKALVIVDMQYGFMNTNTKYLEKEICGFIDNYKDDFDIIAATQYVNSEDTPCYKFEGWKECMAGSHDAEVLDSIKQRVSVVIPKGVYSCWLELVDNNICTPYFDKIYFVGVNTGCCVLHSAFDAYNNLQDCAVISDLCGSTSGYGSHLAALQVLRECITKQRVIEADKFKEEN